MKTSSAKQRILDTASSLFHERGYKEVGINEIIEKSGTAKATFYSHFPSKEKLGETWLAQIHDRSEIQRAQFLGESGEGLEKLTAYFKDLRRFLQKGSYRGCPYTNTAAVIAEEESCLLSQVTIHKNSIRKFFQTLAKQASPDPKKARKLGDQLFLLYSGASTEGQNLKKPWPVDSALTAAIQLWKQA